MRKPIRNRFAQHALCTEQRIVNSFPGYNQNTPLAGIIRSFNKIANLLKSCPFRCSMQIKNSLYFKLFPFKTFRQRPVHLRKIVFSYTFPALQDFKSYRYLFIFSDFNFFRFNIVCMAVCPYTPDSFNRLLPNITIGH